MRYFQNIVFMSEKRDAKSWQRLLARFVSVPFNRLKNLSAAVNATRSATRILLRGRRPEPKVKFFFAQNLSSLSPVPNKLMLLKRIKEGVWRAEPLAAG